MLPNPPSNSTRPEQLSSNCKSTTHALHNTIKVVVSPKQNYKNTSKKPIKCSTNKYVTTTNTNLIYLTHTRKRILNLFTCMHIFI